MGLMEYGVEPLDMNDDLDREAIGYLPSRFHAAEGDILSALVIGRRPDLWFALYSFVVALAAATDGVISDPQSGEQYDASGVPTRSLLEQLYPERHWEQEAWLSLEGARADATKVSRTKPGRFWRRR